MNLKDMISLIKVVPCHALIKVYVQNKKVYIQEPVAKHSTELLILLLLNMVLLVYSRVIGSATSPCFHYASVLTCH